MKPDINVLQNIWVKGLNKDLNKDFEKDLKKESKNEEEKKSKEMVEEFKETTTIHGIRHVFGENRSYCQRLCWSLLVLSCVVVSIVNINDRIVYYQSYPKSANVEVHYNATLIFPAVTICNQNAFRRTKSFANNHFDAIKKIYSRNKNVGKTGQIPMGTLYRMNGHDKIDLIVKCSWGGQTCSSDNFTEILTSYGLCYTFNGKDVQPTLTIDSAGRSSGLNLILNVEEYDYMPGPNDGAGIKMILHQQNELPVPAEYGQELPTGREGFVNVEMSKISYLPHPHGNCESKSLNIFTNYSYSVRSCTLECLRQQVIDKCRCREMDTLDRPESVPICTVRQYANCVQEVKESVPICTVRQYANCVQEVKGKVATRSACGNCPVPCNNTIYKSSISYGSISQFSLSEGKILENQNVRRRFYDAREKAFLVEENYERLSELQSKLKDVMPEYKAKLKLLAECDEKLKQCDTEANYTMHTVYKYVIRGLESKLDVYKRYPQFKSKLHFGPIGVTDAKLAETLQTFIGTISALIRIKLKDDDISAHVNSTKLTLNSMLWYATDLLTYESEIVWLQSQYVNIWLPGIEHDIDNHQQDGVVYHKDKNITSNNIFKLTKEVVHALHDIEQLMGNFLESGADFDVKTFLSDITIIYKNCIEFYSKKVLIYEFYEDYVEANFIHLKLIIEDKRERLAETWQTQKCDVREFISTILTISNNFTVGAKKLGKYVSHQKGTMENLKTYFLNDNIHYMIDAIESFGLSSLGFLTKEAFSRECFLHLLNDYKDFMDWILIIAPYIPKLNVSPGKCYLSIDTSVQMLTALEKHDDVWSNLIPPVEEIFKVFEKYSETLLMDSKFYSDNFVHLNVLFQDLSYQEISHQKAYDIFALLGDIGGSLGLFIGASFLSLCEAVEFFYILFVVLVTSRKCQRNAGGKQSGTTVEIIKENTSKT